MGFENKTGLRSLLKKSSELELSLVKVAIPVTGRRRGRRAHRGHADQSLRPGTSSGRSIQQALARDAPGFRYPSYRSAAANQHRLQITNCSVVRGEG